MWKIKYFRMVPCGKLNISGWFHVENDRQSYAKYYLFFIPEG